MSRTLQRVRSYSSRLGPRRAISLLMLAALVLVLASAARNPNNWRWLASLDEKPNVSPSEPAPEKTVPSVATGPTDLDPEQAEAIREELQAVTDGTTETLKEEMPAYWRLLRWTRNQTVDQMLGRAKTDVTLHDLLRRSDQHRGKLCKVELNIRRILSYETPRNPDGVPRVYEVWGWSDDTLSWLYVGIVPEIPAGMPTGAAIQERATLVGYFFKVQGYQAAQSLSSDKPLSAPLFIGRLDWHPQEQAASPFSDPNWVWVAVGCLGVLAVGAAIWPFWRQKPRRSRPSTGESHIYPEDRNSHYKGQNGATYDPKGLE